MAEDTPNPTNQPDPESLTPADAADPIAGPTAAAPDEGGDLAEELLAGATAATQAIAEETGTPQSPDMPEFNHLEVGDGVEGGGDDGALAMLDDVDLKVTVELGRTAMLVEDVLRLNEHSVIELDRAAGDPVDIYVNGRHVARGEVLVVNENFCVRVNEIIPCPGIEEQN